MPFHTFKYKHTHSYSNVYMPWMRIPCPMSRVLTDSFTHAYAKCKNSYLCSINDHFSKIKAFCFITKTHFIYQNLVFLYICGPPIFGFKNRRTPYASSTFLQAFTVDDHVQPQLRGILPLLTLLRAFTAGDHVQPQLNRHSAPFDIFTDFHRW